MLGSSHIPHHEAVSHLSLLFLAVKGMISLRIQREFPLCLLLAVEVSFT